MVNMPFEVTNLSLIEPNSLFNFGNLGEGGAFTCHFFNKHALLLVTEGGQLDDAAQLEVSLARHSIQLCQCSFGIRRRRFDSLS